MAKEMNVAFNADFDLLGTKLSATYESNESGSKFLLLPTKVESPNSVSVREMLDEFKKAVGLSDAEAGTIQTQLESAKDNKKPEGKSFDLLAARVQLKSAFLYKNMPKSGTGETEYAIAAEIDMAKALPDLGFVKLNSLSVAIWNTGRASVIQMMGTGKIEKLLNDLK